MMDSPMPVFNNSATTHFKYVKCNFTWTVDNFSLCPKKIGEYLQSPTFSANDEYKWCMLFYPKGNTRDERMQFSLKLIHSSKKQVQANYKLSILNKQGEKVAVVDSQGVREISQSQSVRIGLQYADYYLYSYASSLLPDDKLTILCEIWVTTDNDGINIPDHANAMQVVSPDCRLSDDFGLMYENQEFSDVTLSAGGQKFRAHKAILAARSPVFKAMFQHDMEEKKLNQINISDIQSATIQEMLRFIYTGKVLNIEKHAKKLLAAADKYALQTLKEMCVTVLCGGTITTKNVTELLVLADLHNIKQLKARAIRFIHTHIIDIMGTPEWISMLQTRPDFLKEVFMNNK